MTNHAVEYEYHTVFCDAVIQHMLQGGAAMEEVYKVLYYIYNIFNNNIYKNCKEYANFRELSEEELWEWVSEKRIAVMSEEANNGKPTRNIHQEILDLITIKGSGLLYLESCYNDLHITSKEEKATCRMALSRLAQRGYIEKIDVGRTGVYKIPQKDFEVMKFDEDQKLDECVNLRLPFYLGDMCETFRDSIILIAGEFNAGKTTFILNTLIRNRDLIVDGKIMPVRYLGGEGGPQEMKKRWRGFRRIDPKLWLPDENLEYLRGIHDYASAIKPGALNFIDYIQFRDGDYTQGAQMMQNIGDKLKGGIAVIAVQKKEGMRLPRSGDLICELPRLVLTMTKLEGIADGDPRGEIEIVKMKFPVAGNHNGRKLQYEITEQGSMFKTIREWGRWPGKK